MRQHNQNLSMAARFPEVALVRRCCSPGEGIKPGVPARSRWRKVTIMALAGTVLGVTAAAMIGANRDSSPAVRDVQPVKAYVMPPLAEGVASISATRRSHIDGAADEINKLEIRNRRLEALVTVLRQRAERQTEVVTEKRTPVTVSYARQ